MRATSQKVAGRPMRIPGQGHAFTFINFSSPRFLNCPAWLSGWTASGGSRCRFLNTILPTVDMFSSTVAANAISTINR
jgi:hypothetical protein